MLKIQIEEHTKYQEFEAITYSLCYERMIHAEFMTHRWERNASSSRAIPYARMKKWILEEPAMPLHLGTNRPGMSGGEEIPEPGDCRNLIRDMLERTYEYCDKLMENYDLHKEVINRYTEPWGWINVVATMGRDQLMNFLHLRCDPAANANMQRLAVGMAQMYVASVPRELEEGNWHIPFAKDQSENKLIWSGARCAWTSYQTVIGKEATWAEAKKRHDDCVQLKHMTPLGHQLLAGSTLGCVPGYTQYRRMINGESTNYFDFGRLEEYKGTKYDYLATREAAKDEGIPGI